MTVIKIYIVVVVLVAWLVTPAECFEKVVPGCDGSSFDCKITDDFVHAYTEDANKLATDEASWDASVNCSLPGYATRTQWEGRKPGPYTSLAKTASIVFIHHTVLQRCFVRADCMKAMKKVEELHRDVNDWDDIGYNFLAGEDGAIYEARGWDRVGAHTRGFNKVSISIAAMGDFMENQPEQKLFDAMKTLLECGVASGRISPNYKLYGHRDARPTESPGDYIYNVIKTWPHFDQKSLRPIEPPYV